MHTAATKDKASFTYVFLACSKKIRPKLVDAPPPRFEKNNVCCNKSIAS